MESAVTRLHVTVVIATLLVPHGPAWGQNSDGPIDPRADAPIAVSLMTFNIRTAEGRDGDNAWPHRKYVVAETIRRFDPHIVGLQEALGEQIEFLEASLPEYRWLGVDRGLNGGTGLSEATPLFYRYREVVPIESGTFWLSPTPELPGRRGRGSRIVTWARFYHLESGRELYVFNTHFTLRRGQRQIQAAEQINARIAGLPPESAVVVMGDFNAVAEWDRTWEVATSQGLRDAWLLAEQRHGPSVTSNGFGPPPPDREGRIDWILVSGPIGVSTVSTVVHSQGSRYPSDHYPVLATLLIGGR
jgi:endonuclease/exonuclease/phosphatase family metal-dependent hydrolase